MLRASRRDSVSVTARAYLLRRDGDVLTPRARTLLTDAILSHFAAPRPLQVPIFSAGPVRMRMLHVEQLTGDSVDSRAPVLYGVYDFALLRNGGLSKVTVSVPTLAPEFDSQVVDAILTSTADSTLLAVQRALDVDSLPLELRISTGPVDTRLRVPPTTLFTAFFPRLELVDAKPLSTNRPAAYPDEERDDGDDGEVALRVVVDASGLPLIPTLEVLHATSPAFALAAARALAQYRFQPAHVGACTVPQVVEVPFWFSLRP
jgi:TonB family protein